MVDHTRQSELQWLTTPVSQKYDGWTRNATVPLGIPFSGFMAKVVGSTMVG